MDVTRTLADFCFHTAFDDIPADVVDKAKRCVLDALGCGFGGTHTELAAMVFEVVRELGGAPSCTVLGSSTRTNCVQAAWANAALISALDYDDTGPQGHPGATVIPSALAAAEQAGATGRDFLAAVVLGYEACCRVGAAMPFSRKRLGEVNGMPWQSLGAAVAASRLLGLTLEQALNAIGLAGATTPLPAAASREPRPLSWVKDNVWWQAGVALQSVLMARQGYVANTRILDRFWVKAGSDQWFPGRVVDGLGLTYSIQATGFKLFPCCYALHNPLRAMVELIEVEDVTADQVESVEVHCPAHVPRRFLVYRPERFVDAEFSLPFVTALALLRRPPAHWMYPENLVDREVLRLADRVTAVVDPDFDEQYQQGATRHPIPALVTVHTSDGRVLKREAIDPFGRAGIRDGWEHLEAKFHDLAQPVLGPAKTEHLVRVIRRLEEVQDVAEVIGTFTTKNTKDTKFSS